jgi:hypothetical protein
MLFNTSETNAILQKANRAFQGTNFSNLRTNPPAGFSTTNLGALHGRSILDWVCLPLHITSGHPKRWKFWCGLLDSTVDSSGQYELSYLIGDAIGDAIHNGNFDAVEFFAVPAAGGTLSVSIADVPDPNVAGQSLKCITIYTGLVDSFPNAPAPGT